LVEGVREVYRNGRPWRSEKLSISAVQHPGETVTRVMEFTVIPNRDPKGSVVGAVLYGADVTDVQGREEQARLERYRVMIEHAHQVALALFEAATAGLVYASPAFASLASPPAAPPAAPGKGAPVSLAGQLWHELGFMEPKEAQQAFEEAVATRQPKRLRRIRHEHDGTETVWDCTMSPVGEQKEGFVRYILVSAVDVTEQALAQAELERSDRLKDEFLSLASHELRTPLTPLSTYSEVLKMLLAERNRDEAWERRMQDTVGKFQSQISQIARLTDDLLDVARLETGRLSIKREPVDLREVLSRAREQTVAGWPAIPVRLSLPEGSEPVVIQGDDQRLLQVFTNLMNNAARHAAGTKQIEVELSLEDGAGPKARVEVRDQGPGIAPEVMRNLFTRFVKGPDAAQSARTGLGLGLFIARGIAEQHGGTIGVVSKAGAGTVFTVELPVDR
jgi:signal transduction histidine kinase